MDFNTPFILLKNSTRPGIDIREWLIKYLYIWRWILLSVFICLIMAYGYIKVAAVKYEIKAKVFIKDQNGQSESQVALKELQLFRDKKAVDNEIEVLKSMQLVRKVVKDLNLNVNYVLNEFPFERDLYDTLPISFIPVNMKADFASFDVSIKDKKTVVIDSKELKGIIPFSRLQRTKSGSWLITPGANLDRYIGKTIEVSYTQPEITSGYLLAQLEVNQTSKLSSIVELILTDHIPERGKDVLNSLIKNYDQDSKGEKDKLATAALEFIDNRLASLSGELTAAEKNIEGYRSDNGLTDISAESRLFLDQVQINDNRLNEVNVQLKILDEVENYINSEQTGNAPATVGISDPTLIDLIRNLNTVQFEREHLLATASENSPLLEPLNRQVRSTQISIRENIANIRSSLNAARGQLTKYNNGFESSIQQLPGQERQLVDRQRKQSIKENLYIYLMQKREEVALSFASTLPENRVIDSAFYTEPYWPNKLLILIFALGCGLLIPASFLVGKSILFPRVTSRNEIEDAVEAPIISELIYQPGKPILVLDERANIALAEQFRSLRTNLKWLHSITQGRVTLITSSIGNEGKSFVSSNLAMALAASGRKTIVLELDLRKPKVSAMFKLSAVQQGITDYLMGEADMCDIIQTSGKNPDLDIISAGKFAENPSELLEDVALDVLISNLRLSYDDVILDTPPVHLVTDAIVLSRFADVSLYLIRQGITSKSELKFIEQLYKSKKLPNLNLVFNGIQRVKYGYGQNYDESYYKKQNLRLS